MLIDVLIMLGLALAFAAVEMTLTWGVARRLRNYSIVDAVWSLGFAPIAAMYLIGRKYQPEQGILFVLMVAFWSLRLGVHLARRIASHHPHEDVRYAKLRTDWGSNADRKMFWFFQLQGALQVVLSLPFLFACSRSTDSKTPLESDWFAIGGCALWLTGLLGESLADRQLARFRADPANKGKVCQTGLWNYSRHPNYFFEWVVWVGYAVFALGSPWGWLGLIAPALMLHFLLNVTGIPMTEELSLKSKGDAYRAYQRTTSAFVPWFKKS
jgi:steroid 5-alpha reductase family enzyme